MGGSFTTMEEDTDPADPVSMSFGGVWQAV
jgi:hypothetical protein